MRKRGSTRRVLLAAAALIATAASCGTAEEGLGEDECYTRYPAMGADIDVDATHTLPDGTALAVDGKVTAGDAFTLVFKTSRIAYEILWSDEVMSYTLSFHTSAGSAEPFDLDAASAELCAKWASGEGAQIPECGTDAGGHTCDPGCVPAHGVGLLHIVTECEGDADRLDKLCDEHVDGELALIASTAGVFGGTLRFATATRLEQTTCPGNGSFGSVGGGCTPDRT